MAKQCTCIRCKAEEMIRKIYPKLNDRQYLMIATELVKAIRLNVDKARAKRA